MVIGPQEEKSGPSIEKNSTLTQRDNANNKVIYFNFLHFLHYQIGGGVSWTREQFPLRPGFVLTVNKSQGNCKFIHLTFLYIIFKAKH